MSKYLTSILLATITFTVCPNSLAYYVGVGKADITDTAINQNLQGFSDPSQKVTGLERRLYSRAFVIGDQNDSTLSNPVVMVILDNWAAVNRVKAEVVARIQANYPSVSEENLMLSSTHTHGGPGGFSDSALYEQVTGGFDPHNFECTLSGIVGSIEQAFQNVAVGKIYVNSGQLTGFASQRSSPAYLNNPLNERLLYGQDVDTEMLLLKFVHDNNGVESAIGVLNWYAVHPTVMGQKSTVITGDSKGYAAYLMEKDRGSFVAAFANANAGDVSSNVGFGSQPDGVNDISNMKLDGQHQATKAEALFDQATETLSGSIDYRHTRVDMSNVNIDSEPGKRTWPGGLGLSFAAGSTEDGTPKIEIGGVVMDSFQLREGIVEPDVSLSERAAQGIIIAALAINFGVTPDTIDFVNGHLPKPLVLRTGLINPPITPNILPLQLIRIGNLVVTAVPGEMTTMAGRRIKDTVLNELSNTGINHLALAGFSNEYSQYITTKEEYDMQHYEGASTLFGPYTLMAYQQEFKKLATALKNGSAVGPGPSADPSSVSTSPRITIRNQSSSRVKVEFFNQSDSVVGGWFDSLAVSLDGSYWIPANSDYAYSMPDAATGSKIKMRIGGSGGKVVEKIRVSDLVKINSDGKKGSIASSYSCPV